MRRTKFNFEISRKINWGDMDALAHVNNAKYFKYFEEARIEYFQELGFSTITARDNEGPILASISCDFLRPIIFPDNILIGTGTLRIGNSSMRMDYEIYSESQNAIVANGTSVMVMIDYKTGEKIRISDSTRTKILSIDPDLEQ